MINLRLPLKDVYITQPFGNDFWYYDDKLNTSYWFYRTLFEQGKMSVPYHPGIDFRAKDACPLYAANSGKITRSGVYSDGGIGIRIQGDGFSTFYYHLKNTLVNIGDNVEAGQLIGYCDNTGKATTGSHLHFELEVGGKTIDPSPYFTASYNGFSIGNKDWDKPRAYHRYYREAKRNLANEMKVALYISRRLKRLPNNVEINAAIWGGWDIEAIINPAMFEIYSQLKKDEFNHGLRPYC